MYKYVPAVTCSHKCIMKVGIRFTFNTYKRFHAIFVIIIIIILIIMMMLISASENATMATLLHSSRMSYLSSHGSVVEEVVTNSTQIY